MDKDLVALDRLLKALADPTRIRIVGLLQGGEVCVCHIHDSLKIPQPKASRHLAYLRKAGVVEAEKRGLWVCTYPARGPAGCRANPARLGTSLRGHLATAQRDAKRLEQETGCCVPAASRPQLTCCSATNA